VLNLLCPLSLDSSYGFLRLSVVLFYHRSFFIVHSLSLLPTSSAGGCLRQYKNRNILYSSDFLFYRTCCLLYFVMLHLCPQEHLTLLRQSFLSHFCHKVFTVKLKVRKAYFAASRTIYFIPFNLFLRFFNFKEI